MRCNGFEGVGTDAVIRRPHHRHVVGKIRAIALVWRKRRAGGADRRGYRAEVIVWLGMTSPPGRFSRRASVTQSEEISPGATVRDLSSLRAAEKACRRSRARGYRNALQGHVGRATDRPVTQPRASSAGATRAEPTTMDVDSTKHSTLATGVRNRVGEDGAQARRLAARMESSGPMTASEWDWTRRVFDHVQLNASDYTASVRFYETVLAPLGIPKIAEHEQGTWSSDWTDFTDLNFLDRRPPTTNLHLCFYARSKEQVDAFHRAGVEAGFRSNGAPGYRDYAPGYYAAYLLDPDGNNVEALYRDVGNIGYGESAALH